jgi:chromatin remodeling complex protein RSC6
MALSQRENRLRDAISPLKNAFLRGKNSENVVISLCALPCSGSEIGEQMAKTAKKKAAPRKANAAFMKPVTPSATLAEVVGSKPMPRTEVTKKLWAYIKKNGLQDKKNKRMINADDKLKGVFKKGTVNMFEMTKLVSKHLS